jgi:hypothetical protein
MRMEACGTGDLFDAEVAKGEEIAEPIQEGPSRVHGDLDSPQFVFLCVLFPLCDLCVKNDQRLAEPIF